MLSCLVLAVRCDGLKVTTIEGLGDRRELDPIQEAALDHDAVQCGFCSPGWIISAKVLLDENPNPTIGEVRMAVAGNLCRCTGYKRIEKAILSAAEKRRGPVE